MEPKTHRHLAHIAAFQVQPLVFLTVSTKDRKRILNTPIVHDTLRAIWANSAEINGWHVGQYTIMPDHVHLFSRPGRDADKMAVWIKAWKSVSSRIINRDLGQSGSVWQEDYFDRYLRSGESYSEKWEYVRANPVRAGLVNSPDDWPFQGVICNLTFD